jgi:hypothetical protein
MTEEEWLGSTDPGPMVKFMEFKASDRKFRLVACGCCRLSEGIFNPAQIQALEAAELFVEGRLGSDEFKEVNKEFGDDYGEFHEALHNDQLPDRKVIARLLISCVCLHQAHPSDCAIEATFGASFLPPSEVRMFYSPDPRPNPFGGLYYPLTFDIRSVPVSGLVRCIFGNPFRPVAFESRWRTSDAVGLARGIYDERAFDRLPLLADALMDAGCDDDQLVGHCRSAGPHARGCWAVDLVLGKR